MSDNLMFLNLGAYTSPEVKEVKYKGWVEYSGGTEYKNNYFQYLIDRAVGSTTNGSIINGISRMIYGKGIGATDASSKTEQYAEMVSLLNPKEVRKIIYDRKLFGMAAIQVTKKAGKVTHVTHFPIQTLRPEIANEDGEIENYYYLPDWSKKKASETPEEISAFGFGGNNGNEIYIVRPYVSGFHYFSPPDYIGALPYAVIEEEIGDFQVNDVLNSFSGTKMINFNNGVPEETKREELKREIKNSVTGATGQRVIVAFNDNAENKATIEDVALDDAPEHYQYLSTECFNKLIVGHRVTSPMLLGIRDGNNGLGNNAEEIKTATLLMDNLTIKPFQMEILEAFNEILKINDISLNLYFKTIEPLEFIDTDGLDKKTTEEETGVELSEDGLTDELGELILEHLAGEDVGDDWELVDARDFDVENESVEDWANRSIKPKKSILSKLSGVVKSKPSSKSDLDKSFYKVRWSYEGGFPGQRDFCFKMMTRTKNGVVYRREDIDLASQAGVNKSLGHNGTAYDLFKFKGGPYCNHYWRENLYRLKKKTDGTFVEDKALSSSEEVDSIPKSYKPKGKKYSDAQTKTKDMPNRGKYR